MQYHIAILASYGRSGGRPSLQINPLTHQLRLRDPFEQIRRRYQEPVRPLPRHVAENQFRFVRSARRGTISAGANQSLRELGAAQTDLAAAKMEDDAFPGAPQERKIAVFTEERRPEIEMEDVEFPHQPKQRNSLSNLPPGTGQLLKVHDPVFGIPEGVPLIDEDFALMTETA